MPELKFIDRQEECWALLHQQKTSKERSLAIFVHGFQGNHLMTWGRLPEMLQKHAQSDPVLASWDFLFLGYPTRNVVTYLDIARIIATQWENAANGKSPSGSVYTRFALIGHSLGTLGIRQLLCAEIMQPPQMFSALHSVTLFGTPLNGSMLALFGFGGGITDALKPGNPQLRMLKVWNDSMFPHLQQHCSQLQKHGVRVVLGTDDQIVGNKYADLIKFKGDAESSLLNFDHSSLVKPANWNNSAIHDEIVGALQ